MFEHATIKYCQAKANMAQDKLSRQTWFRNSLLECLFQYIKVNEIADGKVRYPSSRDMLQVYLTLHEEIAKLPGPGAQSKEIQQVDAECGSPWRNSIHTPNGKKWAAALMRAAIEIPSAFQGSAETVEERASNMEVMIREALKGVWSYWEPYFDRLWMQARIQAGLNA